jgi:cysteine synthase
MTLVDFSSGNAGRALGLVGKLKGYKVVVRPAGLSRVLGCYGTICDVYKDTKRTADRGSTR